uniref:TIGR03960 family B12-binding radical SAM protein n=1 Tax=candidate division WOR-3 bacterium TaxID=2052148 RepID=A0A7C4CBU3_UNCW3
MHDKLDEVLPLVAKPVRYTGGEYNSLLRDPDPERVSWVLAMPEVYEIGASNYGLRILYSIINRLPDAQCERCFAPWPDFGQALNAAGLPLYALESKRPVRDFDVLGVSLQSELGCTNLPYLLDLCRIPLRREERRPEDPLVVAGGPCAVNPLPLERFVDAFVVGDGEETVREINTVVRDWNGRVRSELLTALSRLTGLYVPGITSRNPGAVRRRAVPELREDEFPAPPVVPICEITHDRLTVEIARGCTRGCRFCQAGIINRPMRFRDPDQIVRLAERGIRASGWEEVSLLSLSALDYPDLPALVRRLNSRLRGKRVSISLPSTRGEDFSPELALDLQDVKKAGLTFAPETASDRLRRLINKSISEERILESVRNALDAGWGGVKLYFMLGLPGETDADVAEIARFVNEVARLCRGRQVRFNVTQFIPKPHTPLQWAAFADIRETQAKIETLRSRLTRRNARPKWESSEASLVQAALARGDERLGEVIELVYRQGGIFQEWTEHFRFSLWQEAFAAAGIDPADYLRQREPEKPLPWDFIDVGVTREFLAEEYRRALAGTPTPDCARAACTGCGACPDRQPPATPIAGAEPAAAPATAQHRLPGTRGHEETRSRFRLRYAVGEPFRYAAHLDRVRAWYRALRRSELPVAYTGGFAPKPMLSFGPPLPVGLTSEGEYLDIFTTRQYSGNIVRDLGPFLPRGLRILAARPVAAMSPSLGRIVNLASYEVTTPVPAAALEPRLQLVPGMRALRPGPEGKVILDVAIVPGVKLFAVLARLFDIDETRARCLNVRRLECLVAGPNRVLTALGLPVGGRVAEELKDAGASSSRPATQED